MERLKASLFGGYASIIVKIFRQCINNVSDKDLKKVFNYFYIESLSMFFLGKFSFKIDDNLPKLYRFNFFEKSVWDFEIYKLNRLNFKDFHMFIEESKDLLFPYIARNSKDYDSININEGTYERFGIEVAEGDVVIDCGANIGLFSLFAGSKHASRVISFEPVNYAHDILIKNLKINNFKETQFITERFGLSNRNENVKISINEENIGSNSIIGNVGVQKTESINVIMLDDYIRDNNISKVDFIKADIEGAERLMLEGAKETLKKFKPKLAICTYHFPDDVEVLTKIIKEANPQYEIYYGHKKLYAK